MARKQKPEEPGPSKAWLVSFGDTMTSLLAFFIVLCSLAEDQTGMNLYTGTGSFVSALNGFGLRGLFSGDKSARTFQLQETSPLYLADNPESDETDPNASGPDTDDNGIRSIDREQDEFKRFLNEMERHSKVETEPSTAGEVTFDFFEPLNATSPHLPESYADIMSQVLPLLRRATHRVDIVVWATMPSRSAWMRAAEQAAGVAEEVAAQANLDESQRNRLRATSRPWIYKDVKRPILTITMRRVHDV